MRVCICDDIPEYRQSLHCYIEQYFIEHHISCSIIEFDSCESVLESKDVKDINIFFIDIELVDKDGLYLIKNLSDLCTNAVFIVVTAYKKYLDDAMDLSILRYIDKPIEQKRIYSALDKAINIIDNSIIKLKGKNGEIIIINKQKIVYAEAKSKRSCIITVDGEIESPIAFRDLKDKLRSSDFIVPHNSFIVNRNYIVRIKRTSLTLKMGEHEILIPVSAPKQKSIKEVFIRR